jgi:hypothetical protein
MLMLTEIEGNVIKYAPINLNRFVEAMEEHILLDVCWKEQLVW